MGYNFYYLYGRKAMGHHMSRTIFYGPKNVRVPKMFEPSKFDCTMVRVLHCDFPTNLVGVVGWCEGGVYLTSPGRPTDIGLQLGKACYPCSG